MPPLLSQTVPAAAVAAPLVAPGVAPPAAEYARWNNPVPSQFTLLDRQHALQSDNDKILEMHPDGIRGVKHLTNYCFLIIYINNITTLANTSRLEGASYLKDWNQGNRKGRLINDQTLPTKVIRSNATGKYLCMGDDSVVFQQDNYDARFCLFHHEYDTLRYRDRYYRKHKYSDRYYRPSKNKTHSNWYVGINKDGSIRCGNVTRKNQKGANFFRVEIPDKAAPSPPFKEQKRKCCTKKKCKKNGTQKTKQSQRCYKNWCKRHRRKFFQLTLKNVKRYFKRCILEKKERIRRCKTR